MVRSTTHRRGWTMNPRLGFGLTRGRWSSRPWRQRRRRLNRWPLSTQTGQWSGRCAWPCAAALERRCGPARWPGDDDGEQDAVTIDEDVAFDAVDLLRAVESSSPGHRRCVDAGGIGHCSRGSPPAASAGAGFTADRAQDASPQPAAAPAQEMLVGCRPSPRVKSCGECRHAQPVRSTLSVASTYSRQAGAAARGHMTADGDHMGRHVAARPICRRAVGCSRVR